MSLKRKLRAKKPPLSLLDKFIYWTIFLISFISAFLLIPLGIDIPMKIAFSDNYVVACENTVAVFCSVPLVLLILFTTTIISGFGINNKQPIFGNKKFKPKFLEPTLKVYPILSKAFWENITQERKTNIRKTLVFFLIALIISILILSLGFYPRTVVDKENNFITYNTFNQVTHTHNIDNAQKLIIQISRSRGFKHSIRLEIVFEEHSHFLNLGSFYKNDTESTLRYMLKLKEYFNDGRYEITYKNRMNYLISDGNYTTSETFLIYQLFDY